MFYSLLLSFAVIAAQSEVWSDWIDILDDAFDDASSVDASSASSFTDVLWDQLSFGDATASSTSSLLDAWLTGVDFDDYLSDITDQLDSFLDPIGNTSSMTTSEIISAIKDAGYYNATNAGWMDGLDLKELTDSLDLIALHLEVLSFEEGMDLTVFPHLDELEAELEKYGYTGLWSLGDIEKYLQDEVVIPASFTDYNDDLDSIIEGLEKINTDSDDAPSIDDVLSSLGNLIDTLQSEVDLGETDLSSPLAKLQIAYDTLELFTLDPTETLLELSEEIRDVFSETNYAYNDLSTELGSDWLSKFISALELIFQTDRDEYAVCEDDFVRAVTYDAYASKFSWARNCWQVALGNAPDCDCLNGADLYDNPEQEAVVSSLNCFFEDGDLLTVEQNLRQCNGEEINVDGMTLIENAFEELKELTELLTVDNYGDGLSLSFDTIELAGQFQDVYDALEELSNVEIDSTGSESEWLDSVSDWIDNFDELVSDMDLDGSYTNQSQIISNAVNNAFDTLTDNDGSDGKEKANIGGDMTLIWVLVAVVLLCFFIMCFFWRKNKKLGSVALVEREGLVDVFGSNQEGNFEAPIRTAVTLGEPDV